MRQCGVPKAPTSDSLRTRPYQDSATLPEPRPAHGSPFSCCVGGPRPMTTHDLFLGGAEGESHAAGDVVPLHDPLHGEVCPHRYGPHRIVSLHMARGTRHQWLAVDDTWRL